MVSVVWFRNDLRLTNHLALDAAIKSGQEIIPLFIYDEKNSRNLGEASKWWLHHSLVALQKSLTEIGADLIFKKGDSFEKLKEICKIFPISNIFWHRRYNPQEIEQDKKIKLFFKQCGINCQSFEGYLLLEPHTVKNKQGNNFQVFSAFWKHCINVYEQKKLITAPNTIKFNEKFKKISINLNELELLPKHNWADNFTKYWQPGEKNAQEKLKIFLENNIENYKKNRDFPDLANNSNLAPHIHFGEISIQQIYNAANNFSINNFESKTQFIAELGWREFAYHTLFYTPNVCEEPINKNFANFPFKENSKFFKAWCFGKTGYPIVDAGMRELWATGYMHNRVRMITASFLIKHLLQPWQNGEKWFWNTLLDADIASNPFNWQWVAGCGYDAAPYFRIFNPIIQSEKFDNEGKYIKKWIPELKNIPNKFIHQPWICNEKTNYPKPIVEHKLARNLALSAYETIKKHPIF